MKTRTIEIISVFIIFLVLAFIALRYSLLTPGLIGLRNDWGIPPYPEQLSVMLTGPFHVWYDLDLGHSIFIQSGAVMGSIFGFFGFLGIDGEIFSKLFVLCVFSLAGFAAFLLFSRFSKNLSAQFIAGLFYLFNPFVFNLFSSGAVQELCAYAISPIIILMFLKALETSKLRCIYALMTALLFVLASAVQQYAVMLFVLLCGLVLFKVGCKSRKAGTKLLLFIPIVWVSLNAWWILPFIGTIEQQGSIISSVASSGFITNIAPVSSILDTLTLSGMPNFFVPAIVESNSTLLSVFQLSSLALIGLVFILLIFRKDRLTLFFAGMLVFLPIFLNSPLFSSSYNALIVLRLFRNAWHLNFLVALSFAVLLGLAVETYSKKINLSKSLFTGRFRYNFKKVFFFSLVFALILMNSTAFFTGSLSSTVHNVSLPSEYREIYEWLLNQKDDFRVVWQPNLTPIVYKPSVYGLSGFFSGGGVDTYIDYSPKPSYGNYFPSDFTQFIEASIHQAPTNNLAYLLSSINSKYLIVREDHETMAPSWSQMARFPEIQRQWSNDYVISKLANQNDITLYETEKNITIFKNDDFKPWVTGYTPSYTYVISGDANAFFVLPTLSAFSKTDAALIFSSQYSKEKSLPSTNENPIVILDYNTFDLVQANIPSRHKIAPGSYAGPDPYNGWVSSSKNQIYTWWWYNYRYTASLSAAALTLTNSTLTIPFDVTQDGLQSMWANVFIGPKASSLTILVDGIEKTEINLSSLERSGFFWINLTQEVLTSGRHTITINSDKGENVIAKIVMAPQTVIEAAIETTKSYLANKTMLLVDSNWNTEIKNIPASTLSIFREVMTPSQNAQKIYFLNGDPQISARFYAGWKNIISTNGKGTSDMLIFTSPSACPYIDAFPSYSPKAWNAVNSTIIYITAGTQPLTINSVQSDGRYVDAVAWWQNDTSWRTNWPITVPPNQRAIIQMQTRASLVTLQTSAGSIVARTTDGWSNPPDIDSNSQASSIYVPESGDYMLSIKFANGEDGNLLLKIGNQTFTLTDHFYKDGTSSHLTADIGPLTLAQGNYTVTLSNKNFTTPVYNGFTNPIDWVTSFTQQGFAARYYNDWKGVIRTDGVATPDMLTFPSLNQSPYIFPSFSPKGWNAINSTLIYLVTGDEPLRIDEILTDNFITKDIGGVWWETGWLGMTTKNVTFPIIIPPNQKAIIQINHKADLISINSNMPQINSALLSSVNSLGNPAGFDLLSYSQPNPEITFEKINPTNYKVHVNTNLPFFLILSESYDSKWAATVDGHQVPDLYHTIANGYANCWYINKTGTFTVILDFQPQVLLNVGATISTTTLIIFGLFLSKTRIKFVYARYLKKPESNQ